MFFITNRELKEPTISNITNDRNVSFDLEKNSPTNSLSYCRRIKKDEYIEIGGNKLMSKLKGCSAKHLLFYIHGFSNLPEPDIFPRTKILQKLFDEKEKDLVKVIPLIWPCDNDFGIIKDYWDDQKAADKSGFSFTRLLERFMQWRLDDDPKNPCLKTINILAHSMGNRVLKKTLKYWNKYDMANGVPQIFRNVFLVAADIVNESLEKGNPSEIISHSGRNISVYYASDDLALRSSKIANLKNKVASKRLGHTGPEDMNKVNSNVYAIDCDNFNNSYDTPMGHSYFLCDDNKKAGKVFNHIFNSISTGRVLANETTRKYIL